MVFVHKQLSAAQVWVHLPHLVPLVTGEGGDKLIMSSWNNWFVAYFPSASRRPWPRLYEGCPAAAGVEQGVVVCVLRLPDAAVLYLVRCVPRSPDRQ